MALVVIGVLFVMALITTSAIAYWFFYALAVLVGVSYLWTRSAANNIRIRRTLLTKWATTGDVIEEEFLLSNLGRLPVLLVELEDHSTLPGYTASVAENLDGRQTKRWTGRGTALRRGLFSLGPMTIRTGDPFGIFVAEFQFDQASSLVVYPPISVMPDFRIPSGSFFGSSRSNARSQQITSDASGVRDLVPGDEMKRIHWLSTARHGTLMVKEFDIEPASSVWVVLDMHRSVQAGQGDESTEEYAVKIASALAYQQVRDGKSVGLAAFGKERLMVEPQKGTRQLWTILENLATVSAEGTASLEEFLMETAPAFGRGMSLVVITPSTSESWVGAFLHLGHRALYPSAVLLDPASFGGKDSMEGLRLTIATAGLSVRMVTKGQQFDTIRPEGGAEAAFELGLRRTFAVASSGRRSK